MKAIILAAGEGKRMKSDRHKVVQSILGKPMITYVIEAAREAYCDDITVVVGYQAELVKSAVSGIEGVSFALQEQRLGTGHAVLSAASALREDGLVFVLSGDVPLIEASTLKALVDVHLLENNIATMISTNVNDPTGYGRIVRDAEGRFTKIVEQKDATAKELDICEVNPAVYLFTAETLLPVLKRLKNDNTQGEYYLTDTLALLLQDGHKVGVLNQPNPEQFCGVNDKYQLSVVVDIMKARINKRLMLSGVTIIDPAQAYISPDVLIGQDTVIYPGAIIEPGTVIGSGCEIGPNTRIVNTVIGDNVAVMNSVCIDSEIGSDTKVGPFAYLRPHSKIGSHCKIGDFVEVKNATIGDGSKASHLTYVGDSDVGQNVNFGCGTVTVNYDGSRKYRTVIKDNAFIGCNTNLIAPVTVEENAYTAAGSTITEDVPRDTLGIARARQINKTGWQRKTNA